MSNCGDNDPCWGSVAQSCRQNSVYACDLMWRLTMRAGESSPCAAPTAATAGDGATAGCAGPLAGNPLQDRRPLPCALPSRPLRAFLPFSNHPQIVKQPRVPVRTFSRPWFAATQLEG